MRRCFSSSLTRVQRLSPRVSISCSSITAGSILPSDLASRQMCAWCSCRPIVQSSTPIERVWRDLKDAVAWLHFAHLEGQQDYVAELLRAYENATLRALTGYPDLVEAIHALCA